MNVYVGTPFSTVQSYFLESGAFRVAGHWLIEFSRLIRLAYFQTDISADNPGYVEDLSFSP